MSTILCETQNNGERRERPNKIAPMFSHPNIWWNQPVNNEYS